MESGAIRYIGVDDLDLDLFESQYVVPEGMSYNSYVILDQKVAVMDTVDERKSKEWQRQLLDTLQDREVDYLVVHHMEPDHSANIAGMMAAYPRMKVVLSATAAKMLPNFFEEVDFEGRTLIVKEGDTLQLGTHTLRFIAAPMVHWPEVIMSYEQTEKVLFSADAFGKFGALQNETDDWSCEARRYYFNICGKYGMQVQNVLKKIASLEVETICPLHGPTLSGDLSSYISIYDTWSRYDAESEGIMIACASIHGGTLKACQKLAEMLHQKGAPKVVLCDLTRSDLAEAIEDAFRYPTLVVAAASYDAGVFPPMHDFLYHLQIKGLQRRRIAIVENGSWAPSAARVMGEMVGQLKCIELVEPVITLRSRLKQADLPQLELLCDHLLKKHC